MGKIKNPFGCVTGLASLANDVELEEATEKAVLDRGRGDSQEFCEFGTWIFAVSKSCVEIVLLTKVWHYLVL